MQSQEIKELATALVVCQTQLKSALKDSENPYFKSKYSDLGSVWDACRKALHDNGLAVSQTTGLGDHGPYLETKLLHTSGQWVSGHYPLNPVKNDPQGLGSAVTYARRYALAAIVGVVSEDDDGHGATHPVRPQAQAPAKVHTHLEAAPRSQTTSSTGGRYKFTWGKNTGKFLDQLETRDLEIHDLEDKNNHGYRDWLLKSISNSGKPVDNKMKELFAEMDAELARRRSSSPAFPGLNAMPRDEDVPYFDKDDVTL